MCMNSVRRTGHLLSEFVDSLRVGQRRDPAPELLKGREEAAGTFGGCRRTLHLLQLAQLALHAVQLAPQGVVGPQFGGQVREAARQRHHVRLQPLKPPLYRPEGRGDSIQRSDCHNLHCPSPP